MDLTEFLKANRFGLLGWQNDLVRLTGAEEDYRGQVHCGGDVIKAGVTAVISSGAAQLLQQALDIAKCQHFGIGKLTSDKTTFP